MAIYFVSSLHSCGRFPSGQAVRFIFFDAAGALPQKDAASILNANKQLPTKYRFQDKIYLIFYIMLLINMLKYSLP